MSSHSWSNPPTAGSAATAIPAFRITGDSAQFQRGVGSSLQSFQYDRTLNKPVNGFQGYTRTNVGIRHFDYVENDVTRQYGLDVRTTIPKGLGATERTALLHEIQSLVMTAEFAAVIQGDLVPQG